MPIILTLITAGYLGLMLAFILGWKKVPDFKLKGLSPENRFSVVIPFRNEEEKLPQLFKTLSAINYPADNFEIILVNDSSEDRSKRLAEKFKNDFPELNIKLLENLRKSPSPKKDAIRTAIDTSKFEYIATTDADCLIPSNWLHFFDEMIQEQHPKLIAGPVGFIQNDKNERHYFQNFEELDFMSLQASTIGSFGLERAFMCNAANLCYEKQAFLKESGFSGSENIASGDDVFLLQNFRKNNLKVAFLKAHKAVVLTSYQKDLSSLLGQRLRWASKTSAYSSNFAKFTGIMVFLMNFILILYAFLALFEVVSYQYLMLAFLLKFNVDFILTYKAAKFMGREAIMRSYFWCSIVYPFFSVYVAGLSLFRGFEWKGRRFKK